MNKYEIIEREFYKFLKNKKNIIELASVKYNKNKEQIEKDLVYKILGRNE